MMHVLICEDDIGQRTHIESVVRKYIAAEDVEMELIVSTGDPIDVLDYLKAHPDSCGLYLLDIDLQHNEIDGMKLGTIIREADPLAKIVFITTYSELAYLTFRYKLQAMDFIVKGSPGDIEARVIACIEAAYERYLEKQDEPTRYFQIDAGGEFWNIPYDEILFFETNLKVRHRIILHTENSKIDFRGVLSEIEQLVPGLYRSHKSFLLNISKIAYLDKSAREAVMVNGAHVHIAEKKMSELMRIMGEQ